MLIIIIGIIICIIIFCVSFIFIKEKSSFGTETSTEYVTSSISHDDGNIIESEDINCKTPVLLEYMTKSKVTIWTFGFGVALTDYVFYVPEGTIQKDVQLK